MAELQAQSIPTVAEPLTQTTVYVGDLNPQTDEAQLNDLLSQNGYTDAKLRSLKIVLDRDTQTSRGYAYVNFIKQEDAKEAIDKLQFSELKGRQIRLMWKDKSVLDNEKNIFVKNTGWMKSKDLHDKFSQFGDIVSAKVVVDDNGQSKNYGFVLFKDKDAVLKSKQVQEDPNEDVEIIEYRDLKNNLYVKNLSKDMTSQDLRQLFESYGQITSVYLGENVEKEQPFGFVCFQDNESSQTAQKELNDYEIGDKKLVVERAEKKAARQKRLKQLFLERKEQLKRNNRDKNLYVYGLHETIDEEKLKNLFQQFCTKGEIASVKIMTDTNFVINQEEGQKQEQKSRGYGFISFTDSSDAQKAKQMMNGQKVNDRRLYVNTLVSKDQRKQYEKSKKPAQDPMQAQMMMQGRGQFPMNPAMMNPMMNPMMRQPWPQFNQMMPGGGQPRMPHMVPNQIMGGGGGGGGMGKQMKMPGMGGGFHQFPYPKQQMFGGGQRPNMGGQQGQMNPMMMQQRPQMGAMPGVQQGMNPMMMNQNMPQMYPQRQVMPQQGMMGGRQQPPMGAMHPPPQGPMPPTVPQQIPVVNPIQGPPQQMPPQQQLPVQQILQMDPVSQKQQFGELLYPRVQQMNQEQAGKITGMLLEMEKNELIQLFSNPDLFQEKVKEAEAVLTQHAAAVN